MSSFDRQRNNSPVDKSWPLAIFSSVRVLFLLEGAQSFLHDFEVNTRNYIQDKLCRETLSPVNHSMKHPPCLRNSSAKTYFHHDVIKFKSAERYCTAETGTHVHTVGEIKILYKKCIKKIFPIKESNFFQLFLFLGVATKSYFEAKSIKYQNNVIYRTKIYHKCHQMQFCSSLSWRKKGLTNITAGWGSGYSSPLSPINRTENMILLVIPFFFYS